MGGVKAAVTQEEARSMHHRNAPLTVVGRQRAIAQVVEVGRPIAHVAAEFHIARTTLSKWVGRFREHGELGLQDHSSAPANRPTRLPIWVLELIESWRRTKKWSARRIARELADGHGFRCCVRTVSRWLDRLGLNRIRDITPDGENLRRPGKIIARYPGHMVHMDVKKVGKIPDGGGWWAHGRGSEQALAGKRAHKQKVGYTYLHSIIDGFSRLAYTEALEDEKAVYDHHLLPPRPSLLRCPRHHQDLPPGHRQRRELHRHGVPPLDLRVHRTPPAHADLHSPP